MSALNKSKNAGKSFPSGKAGARGRDLACDGRPPPKLRELDTPPSNTGVNNGLPQCEKAEEQ